MASNVSTLDPIETLARRIREARLPVPAIRRRIREDAGVSLRMAAKALGVAPMTVFRWERGDGPPIKHAVTYRRFLDEIEAALRAGA